MAKAKSSNEFWRMLRKFKFINAKHNYVNMETWQGYLLNLQMGTLNLNMDCYAPSCEVDELDKLITKEELLSIIRKSRAKTAPGLDNIPINLWKKNMEKITNYLLLSLNLALEK